MNFFQTKIQSKLFLNPILEEKLLKICCDELNSVFAVLEFKPLCFYQNKKVLVATFVLICHALDGEDTQSRKASLFVKHNSHRRRFKVLHRYIKPVKTSTILKPEYSPLFEK